MLIEVHMLQNYAPSNLNRDDTGAPKDAIFGNALRARISSQAMKRAIRKSAVFAEAFGGTGLLANRTRRLPAQLRRRLEQSGLDAAAVDTIVNRSQEIGRESGRQITASTEAGDPETAQLIFLGEEEIDLLAERLAALYQEVGDAGFKKLKVEEITRRMGASVARSVDIAMFGRMTTSAAFENVDAAVQVAHAISTHRIDPEFDYYTAVDDISGEAGAGFIGDTAFNSATYYKYASIHWEGLLGNLGGDSDVAAQAVAAFVEAWATTNPSGKQNSFAAHNLPDLVLVEVRERNLPVSYANAFVKPVWGTSGESLMDASVDALARYLKKLDEVYDLASRSRRGWVGTGDWDALGQTRLASLSELVAWLPLGREAIA
ncbi:MAG TPA: type I-E CRISPR-associated protein Cas7/Cse4/CasC [Thermomicrobiaceae bacterium]|nr:type I-E CRISPR-associated protein Cas7/Cse4/CasC [Thermomicrobiaceae bacterium]